jgi:hypothetical protein
MPLRDLRGTRDMTWCSRWPNSWKTVVTSSWVRSGSPVPSGGVKFAPDHADVGLEPAPVRGPAGDQRVHPGAGALRGAGEEVGVEGPEVGAVLVVQVVGAHVGVPGGGVPGLLHPDAEEAFHQPEQPVQHGAQGEVGPERLVVEIEPGRPHALGDVAEVPRTQLGQAELLACEALELPPLDLEVGPRARRQLLLEGVGPGAGPDHAVLEHQVGVVGVAEEVRQLAAQGEDLPQQRPVVVLAAGRDRVVGPEELAPQLAVRGVLHEGHVGGRLQAEAVGALGVAVGPSVGGRAALHALGQPGQPRLVAHDQLVGVRGVEDVLGEARAELRQLDLHGLGAPALLVGQVGAGAPELLDGLAQVARAQRVEARGVVRGRVALDHAPQLEVRRQPLHERRVLGQDLVEGRARRGRVHRVVEVPDEPEDADRPLDEAREASDHGVVGRFRGPALEVLELRGGPGEGGADRGRVVRDLDAVEGHAVSAAQQRVRGGVRLRLASYCHGSPRRAACGAATGRS